MKPWNLDFLKTAAQDVRRGPWRILALSVAVGIAAGLGAIAFYTMLDYAKAFFLNVLANYYPAGPGGEPPLWEPAAAPGGVRRLVLFLLPAAGGLLSGLLVWRFAPEAEGHGTDAAIEAYHHKGGRMRGRVPFIKAIASAITIGSGGSGGREGPIAQIGGGVGSILARLLKLSERETRILLSAGIAGGVGAIFHAPMAGALFAAEVLYSDLELEYEVLIPSILSSITAYAVFALRFGWDPLFATPHFAFENPTQLLPYALLALAVAAGGIFYVRAFYGVRALFHTSRIHPALRPAVGGLVVGAIGFLVPDALGTGYGPIQSALVADSPLAERFGTIGVGLLLAIFAAKVLTTAFSIGSGGSGGVFGPAVVIGGVLGGAVGMLAQRAFPGMHIQPGAFVMVGMAGFFAAVAKTPISTVIMVSELTGNYSLLVPSMWVCIIAYLLARRHKLYEKQLPNRFAAPVHRGHMIEAVLRNITVGDVLARRPTEEAYSATPSTTLRGLLARLGDIPHGTLPVTDVNGRLLGMIVGHDLRSLVAAGEAVNDLIIAADLMVPPLTVQDDEPLLTAVSRMTAHAMDDILVVDSRHPSLLLAVLSHRNILSAYHAELVRDPEVSFSAET